MSSRAKDQRGLPEKIADQHRGGVTAEQIEAGEVIGTQININSAQSVSEAPGHAPLRESYLRRVVKLAGDLTLAGVDPAVAAKQDGAALKLEAVYTALLTTAPKKRERPDRDAALALERGAGHEASSALEQLDRHPKLVLLGEPGSGKSTFSNHVALCLAGELLGSERANFKVLTAPLPDDEGEDREETQTWNHPPLLPVRVVLRDFAATGLPEVGERASASHLWSFVEETLTTAELGDYAASLKNELQAEGGLILLDGLDEVPEAEGRRRQILQAVEDFAASFGKCRFLVTCRTYAYQEQRWRLSDFEAAELAPLSDGQVKRFIGRWYGYVGVLREMKPADAEGRAELLKRAVFSSERLRELAARPLLLTLMASLHAWRGGSLPEKREELYSDAVDLMLYFWEERRAEKDRAGGSVLAAESLTEFLKVGRDAVRRQLEELAFEAHRSQPSLVGTADVPEDRLVQCLMKISKSPDARPRRLLEYLRDRAGLLAERGVGIYTFPHRTIQEYLAACHLTDLDFPYELSELARGDAERWHEVVLLAGAKAGRGSSAAVWLLADALCFNDPDESGDELSDCQGARLAGLLLAESGNLEHVSERQRKILDRVRRWQVELLTGEALPARERVECGQSAGVLGDWRESVRTVDAMEFCWVPAGGFQMGSEEDGDEKPTHEYELGYDYWLARYPVTNAHFREFVEAGGYREARFWREAELAGVWKEGQLILGDSVIEGPVRFSEPFGLPNHPVVGVSWYEAQAFCRWLTEGFRAKGWLTEGVACRLPNEPEWEKVARGGLQVPEEQICRVVAKLQEVSSVPLIENTEPERRYPWVGEIDGERCNFGQEIGTTNAVGCYSKGISPHGCEELSGNVWEWTRSRWGEDLWEPEFAYPYVPGDGREDADTDIAKSLWVLRGGSYFGLDGLVRCSARLRNGPRNRHGSVGFRVALSPI